ILEPYYPAFVLGGNKKIKLSAIPDEINKNGMNGLLSVLKPLTNKKYHQHYREQNIAFIDMESFWIMDYFPDLPNKRVLLVPTDKGDGLALKDFLKNISQAALVIKDALVKLLK
ncbi:MAG: hypothetical protein MJB14_00850, partial [Spirochaetes bacterium]|nr:hypothetical protein [Spirochaetota bacterium]